MQVQNCILGSLVSSVFGDLSFFFMLLKCFTCYWEIVSCTLGMQKSTSQDRNRLVLDMNGQSVSNTPDSVLVRYTRHHFTGFPTSFSSRLRFTNRDHIHGAETGSLLELTTRQAFRSICCKIVIF